MGFSVGNSSAFSFTGSSPGVDVFTNNGPVGISGSTYVGGGLTVGPVGNASSDVITNNIAIVHTRNVASGYSDQTDDYFAGTFTWDNFVSSSSWNIDDQTTSTAVLSISKTSDTTTFSSNVITLATGFGNGFIGNGSGLTNLNATNLVNGTIPFSAFPQTGIGTNGNVLTTSGSAVSWVAPTGGSGPVAGTNINVTGTTVSVSTNVLTNNNVAAIVVSNAVTMTSSGTSSPVLTLNATGGATPSATLQATAAGLAITANSASPILANGLLATGTYGIQIPSTGGGVTNASQQPFAGLPIGAVPDQFATECFLAVQAMRRVNANSVPTSMMT